MRELDCVKGTTAVPFLLSRISRIAGISRILLVSSVATLESLFARDLPAGEVTQMFTDRLFSAKIHLVNRCNLWQLLYSNIFQFH